MPDTLFDEFRNFVLKDFDLNGDAGRALVAADYFLEHGQIRLAASAYDRAYGLNPEDDDIRRLRGDLLSELAIDEHGLHFRYVPAGTFLMGADDGDADERPVHPVTLGDYWVADIPVTWSAYAHLLNFEPPPQAYPDWKSEDRMPMFHLSQKNKIRLQYCETETQQARDWHGHVPDQEWESGGRIVRAEEIFGRIPREDPSRPFEYNVKPMVAVSWQEAEELCKSLCSDAVDYHLPSEAQWEKAARGGLVGKRYSWGNVSPGSHNCDFGHFGDWVIRNPLTIPPNGYGLHGLCGGVWEWTQDDYDSLAYSMPAETRDETEATSAGMISRLLNFVRRSPQSQNEEQPDRVLRGGSWADCAEAVTVSFRMSRSSVHWKDDDWCSALTPTIGFRVCRTERTSESAPIL